MTKPRIKGLSKNRKLEVFTKVEMDCELKNPRIWGTCELGDPPVFRMTASRGNTQGHVQDLLEYTKETSTTMLMNNKDMLSEATHSSRHWLPQFGSNWEVGWKTSKDCMAYRMEAAAN